MGAKNVPFQKVNVSLVEKAQWHLDFNGGFVPILETPAGTMINESGFIAEFANGLAGPDQGLKLWPHEAAPLGDIEANIETGKHKLFAQAFDKATFGAFFQAFLSKYEDEEKNKVLKTALIAAEAMIVKQMNGAPWLSGRDHPMYIDISCYVVCERLVNLKGGVFDAAYQFLEVEQNAPTLLAWVKRFQEHDSFKAHIIGHTENDRQNKLQNSMEKGVKHQLSNTIFEN